MDEMTAVSDRGKSLLTKATTLVRQSLFANAGYLLGINLVGSLVGFVFWGLAARLYRAEEVGMASAVLSAAALVSGIAGLGMGNGLVRFLPKAQSPHSLLNTTFTFNAVVATLVGAVFLVGLPLWSPTLVVLWEDVLYTVGFLIYTIAVTLTAVVKMAFVARRQAFYALAQTCVANGVRLLLVAMLAGLRTVGLVGSVVLAVVLALIISLLGFLPRVERGYWPHPSVSWSKFVAIIPYSIGNYVAGLLGQVSQTVLPLMILEALGPASSGHAYVALMLGSLSTSPGMALAGSAFAEGSNAPDKLVSILTKAAALSLALTIPIAVLLGIGAPWFLLIFGPSYAQEASGLLRWLALGTPLVALNWLYFTYLRVKKQIGRLIVLSSVVAVATLGIAGVLMPRIGVAAVGMGLLVGNGVVTAIALGRMVRRYG
jgi:O-antigen/teichoic acid export membrane protein